MREVDPIPSNARKAAIQEAAEKYAERAGLGVGGDVDDLVRRLGGRIHYREFKAAGKGAESIRVRGVRDFDVFVPLDTPLARDRFTLAHELGHLLLHYPLVRNRYQDEPDLVMIAHRYLPDNPTPEVERCEREANWFAAGLLMPSGPFIAVWREADQDEGAVAQRFRVSKPAVRNRVSSLKAGGLLV